MRKIKFRAWCEGTHDSLTFSKQHMDYDVAVSPSGNWLDVESGWDIQGEYSTIPIMQFTGLKDKNGKEIYEGDIVLVRDMNKDDEESYITVEWFEDICQAGWSLTSIGWYREELEVIGNIHENKELIKTTTNEH